MSTKTWMRQYMGAQRGIVRNAGVAKTWVWQHPGVQRVVVRNAGVSLCAHGMGYDVKHELHLKLTFSTHNISSTSGDGLSQG